MPKKTTQTAPTRKTGRPRWGNDIVHIIQLRLDKPLLDKLEALRDHARDALGESISDTAATRYAINAAYKLLGLNDAKTPHASADSDNP